MLHLLEPPMEGPVQEWRRRRRSKSGLAHAVLSSLVKVKAQKDKRLVGPFLIWLKFEHSKAKARATPKLAWGEHTGKDPRAETGCAEAM